MRRFTRLLAALLVGAALAGALTVTVTPAPAAEGEASSWRLEQPLPPQPGPGVPQSAVPIGLGSVGDIEFPEGDPARGLLITHGNGETIPAGVWAYDGTQWREISKVCGATDGRIAWAGPDEFWTVSDGRAGQVNEGAGTGFEKVIPLEDNTLCHFAAGAVVGSYAHPAGEADSYQAMHGAACASSPLPGGTSNDCWFGGDPLPEPQIGSFHLHWNGSALEAAPYQGEGHPVMDMRDLEGVIYESVQVSGTDRVAKSMSSYPVLHTLDSEVTPPINPEEGEVPLYGSARELTDALGPLRLSTAEGVLWGAAGPSQKRIEGSEEAGQVTVVRRVAGIWTQIFGPGSPPNGTPANPLTHVLPSEAEERELLGRTATGATVSAIAAEPGTEDAWLALRPPTGSGRGVGALLVHVSAEGKLLGAQTLPSPQEREHGIGPKGAAAHLACPAVEDCWMVTTEGWLYHLAPEGERTLERSEMPGFEEPGVEKVIEYRPPDQGLPPQVGLAPPADTSGEITEPPPVSTVIPETHTEGKVQLPLLSHVHSRLVHGNTLELRFHLAVKARVRLLAKRHGRLVAATPRLKLNAGNRRLELRLNTRSWPTKLVFQSQALAPLPVVSSVTGEGGNVTTVGTGLWVLHPGGALFGSGWLR